ncbi:hypothetical protein MPK67_gp076 [Erwinia phage pEa_SNUABM_32]|uniref:Uncharacterized protein n=2 Tax=Alexandravirus TaxID=2733088 RepID=A0AAE7XL27_9CAUD|nr:hypothetical protein MPK67_gp076 [Erwinia phage pEa_SNUABM_32]YP_010301189.1 hypothetical protein MPK68_gp076 [Erwinia phage pEa_SNUABM_3]QZE56612.1 hypothetical protein pEaSNUABM20_00076 [Erwinia phage pEa_SNUABM_20]QZE58292.1 hypothetical protein pEaSNUABM40_00076 [Erwinia phage pEa_SNUABM_40]UAW52857.1 hypothetical protein pEaSNUABM23_00075 [Erwinia phage pEa_SNUABM_23]UIW10753.1 hypothetical protein pEaSNUABM23_00075 [Erwinia phage pEa_SNUABM_31]QZE56273.1 hypothetical protein pEaSNUAB
MSKAIELFRKYWKVFASVVVLVVAALLFRRPKTSPSTVTGEQKAAENTREAAIENQVQDSKTVNEAVKDLNTRKPETDVKPPSVDDSMDELVDRYNKL